MRTAALVLLALAACGPPRGYRPEVEVNFMRACEAQPAAVDGRCRCIWDKIEAEVAPNDFHALEGLPPAARAAAPLQRQIENYARACMGTAAPAPR